MSRNVSGKEMALILGALQGRAVKERLDADRAQELVPEFDGLGQNVQRRKAAALDCVELAEALADGRVVVDANQALSEQPSGG